MNRSSSTNLWESPRRGERSSKRDMKSQLRKVRRCNLLLRRKLSSRFLTSRNLTKLRNRLLKLMRRKWKSFKRSMMKKKWRKPKKLKSLLMNSKRQMKKFLERSSKTLSQFKQSLRTWKSTSTTTASNRSPRLTSSPKPQSARNSSPKLKLCPKRT